MQSAGGDGWGGSAQVAVPFACIWDIDLHVYAKNHLFRDHSRTSSVASVPCISCYLVIVQYALGMGC